MDGERARVAFRFTRQIRDKDQQSEPSRHSLRSWGQDYVDAPFKALLLFHT